MYSSQAGYAVEPRVGETELISCGFCIATNASSFPRHAAHLEEIGEIGVKLNRKTDFYWSETVVDKLDRFEASRLAQEFGPCDVQSSTRQHQLPGAIHIGIGQVHDKEKIVFLNRGIEQKRSSIAQLELKARKESRSFMVETFLPEASRLNIAVAVENCERVTVLENLSDVIRRRFSRENIKCVFDLGGVVFHIKTLRMHGNVGRVEKINPSSFVYFNISSEVIKTWENDRTILTCSAHGRLW